MEAAWTVALLATVTMIPSGVSRSSLRDAVVSARWVVHPVSGAHSFFVGTSGVSLAMSAWYGLLARLIVREEGVIN